jgi:hypothetical protein
MGKLRNACKCFVKKPKARDLLADKDVYGKMMIYVRGIECEDMDWISCKISPFVGFCEI